MDVKKTKVESLDIIVTMMEDKPYYGIKYKEIGSDHFCIGYSSYRLDYVLEWKKQYFELEVKQMRLIDIDTTYPLLKERLTWLGQYGDDVYRLACECIRGVMETQPTAHDVDKVVKQLEKELQLADKEKARCARENPLQFDSAKGYASGIATAIEIVKGGGINE